MNKFEMHITFDALFQTMANWIEGARRSGRPDGQVIYEMYDFQHASKKTMELACAGAVDRLRGDDTALHKAALPTAAALQALADLEFDFGMDMYSAAAATTENEEAFAAKSATLLAELSTFADQLREQKDIEKLLHLVVNARQAFLALRRDEPAEAIALFREKLADDQPPQQAAGTVHDIRDTIAALEKVKDKIVAHLEETTDLEDEKRPFYIGDTKEAYFSFVAAWQMLNGSHPSDKENMTACRRFLDGGGSRAQQALSELGTLKGDPIERLTAEFAIRVDEVQRDFAKFVQEEELPVPDHIDRVTKESETTYIIPCAECGQKAMGFVQGPDHFGQKEAVNFSGIASSWAIPLEDADTIFTMLANGKFAELNNVMFNKYGHDGGLDGYCPECDLAYCRKHNNVREFWDDGYYDYSMGTCPKGHEREVDD